MSNILWQEGIIPHGEFERPAGKCVYWMCGDDEENFKKNPKPGYTETSITYCYNSHGFRTKEFDLTSNKKTVLFFGCSHTEGIGLRESDTWVYKVAQNFPDHNCYNLGVGGGSPDMVTRMLYNTCSLFQPNVVFIMWPSLIRFETYEICCLDKSGYPPTKRGPWDATKETMFLYEDNHSKQAFMKNQAIVKLLKNIYNFKLVEFADGEIDPLVWSIYPIVDSARDDHLSPAIHTAIANVMTTRYNEIS